MEIRTKDVMEVDRRLSDFIEESAVSYSNFSIESEIMKNWPSPNSNLETGMDEHLSKMLELKQEIKQENTRPSSPEHKKKRGRRPIRPLDPIKKKTEEKDKY